MTTEGEFAAGIPRVLLPSGVPPLDWDVAADGERFVMAKPAESGVGLQGRQVHIVLNWFEELKRLVPVN